MKWIVLTLFILVTGMGGGILTHLHPNKKLTIEIIVAIISGIGGYSIFAFID